MLTQWTTKRLAPAAIGLGTALFAAATFAPQTADACGCFAPPDPSVPVVQAGEQIVFSHDDGVVTAHIQIQAAGDAEDFGWLLPLPGIPEFELSIEDLFTQVINTTQPKYRLNRIFDDSCGDIALPPSFQAGASDSSENSRGDDIAVKQDSVGPYDYAVLKADDRQEMLDWLTNNNYFIPTGTEDVVGPYINEGAYFLALKLRKGESTANLQPVKLTYESEKPMIPIILTSVAANPDMGIRVWVLGQDRAIPHNYRHTVLNEEHIDWFNAGQNYNEVVIAATNEATDGQSFVTEYAGTTEVMDNRLYFDGRFGQASDFEGIEDPSAYVQALRANSFNFDSALIAALRTQIPFPAGLADLGVEEIGFYANIDWYLSDDFKNQNPEVFEGYEIDFNGAELTTLIWERIVVPTIAASDLFDKFPKMTRMYTTLSPEEMTKDPVFSFNSTLPDVNNEHDATFSQLCSSPGELTGAGILTLPDGRKFYIEDQTEWTQRNRTGVPFSTRIELLREGTGETEIEVNNAARVSQGDSSAGGCACSAEGETNNGLGSSALLAGFMGLVLVARRRRR